MEFVKVHGTGNDFVLLPDLDDRRPLSTALVVALCAPHTGLGADGVIRVAPARNGTDDVFMDYRNADGSVAEMCGNGVRCVAKYVADRGIVSGDVIRVDTRGGTKVVDVVGRDVGGRVVRVRVDMGPPTLQDLRRTVTLAADDGRDPGHIEVTTLSMGNPHAVAVADDLDRWPLERIGAVLQRHPAFPEGVNLEVVTIDDRQRLRGRIFERGVGETMASGTGACAMAVAAIAGGLTDARVTVSLRGGLLHVDWTQEAVQVTGPAVEVAHGTLDDTWLSQI